MVNRIKKYITMGMFSLFSLLVGSTNVLAIDENECESFFSSDLLSLMKTTYKTVSLMMVVALIIFGIIDFIQGLSGDKDDALKKAGSKFLKRTLIVVFVILLPVVLDFLLAIFMPDIASCLNGF